jgi:hypothetical protein
MLMDMLGGHFIPKLRFDDLLNVAAGRVGGNPAILAFGSKLVPTDRTNITYASRTTSQRRRKSCWETVTRQRGRHEND